MFFGKKKSSVSETQVMAFFDSLMQTSHAVHLFVEKVFFAHTDITMVQFGILKQLSQKGGKAETMQELSCDHHTTKGNLSGIVDRMIDAGLLARREATHDRRRKQISLTPLGRKKISEIETLMRKHIPAFIKQTENVSLVEMTQALITIRDIHISALQKHI